MNAYFGVASFDLASAPRTQQAPAARGVFGRILDRVMEARAAQARYEIARYSHIARFSAMADDLAETRDAAR